ncbi:hypothetical protein [Aquella oligotrophica]|uniref:hypothetical protein n=1 Tax=Aquella oligotrophica TaxID=2067065 RepID=UPI001C99C2EF|nr:hypothetical protein [Aquella oligotrophica]
MNQYRTSKKKSWVEKRNCSKPPHVKVIDKDFAGIPAGSKLLISSPPEIDEFIRSIPKGKLIEPLEMRQKLAKRHHADATCPVSTGIFLRIVVEAALEEYKSGKPLASITPFWRIIGPNSTLSKKLSVSYDEIDFIKRLASE